MKHSVFQTCYKITQITRMNRLQVLDKTITPFTEARLSADDDAKAELFCPRKQYASKKR